MSAPALRLNGVLETALYVNDLPRAQRFYEETFGLIALSQDDRLCALDCGPASVLLLFARGATSETVKLPGGEIPAHDGSGHIHFAFAVAKEDLLAWERRLTERGVEIEARMKWPAGGQSLYFRDPDGNLGEIATPGLWKNY
jgi:catechol 2,3-dioxygenase-like lactoylglutathione lyase family enzyme